MINISMENKSTRELLEKIVNWLHEWHRRQRQQQRAEKKHTAVTTIWLSCDGSTQKYSISCLNFCLELSASFSFYLKAGWCRFIYRHVIETEQMMRDQYIEKRKRVTGQINALNLNAFNANWKLLPLLQCAHSNTFK